MEYGDACKVNIEYSKVIALFFVANIRGKVGIAQIAFRVFARS
jgi:hypothetical protein